MAKIDLKYPVYAPATETASTISYAAGAVLAKAISAKISVNTNDEKLYADGAVAESDHSFADGTITIDIDDLYDAAKVALLGYLEGAVADAGIGTKEMTAGGSASPAIVGFGYYGRVVRSGQTRYRAIWLKKVQFSEPDDEFATKADKTTFGTASLEGTIMVDVTGDWKKEATFATEASAKAWLDAIAGLPVTASTGLTALALTGTGGVLSPAFSAANRYYTFGSVTAASITLTATAAAHTIKLYDNGVLVQNLTSGIASSAITLALGTKKLVIVAEQVGKTPQSTEIIVVKTA